VAGIDAEADGDVDGLVELGERGALDQRHRVRDRILPRAVDFGDRGTELLP